LKAGLKVFAEKGYRGATMDDIALELEATKGLLYYHFATKEQILNAILAETQLIAGIEAGLTIPSGMPLAEALHQAVNRSLDLMESNGELVRFLHVQALLSGPEAELVYTQVLERLYEVSARWIETFKRTGEVRPDLNARTFGQLLVDFMSSYFLLKQIFGQHAQPPREYVDGVLQILLDGIAADKAESRSLKSGAAEAPSCGADG
jgi:AcrR family transcriptional regulator